MFCGVCLCARWLFIAAVFQKVTHKKRPDENPARLKVTTKSKPAYEKI